MGVRSIESGGTPAGVPHAFSLDRIPDEQLDVYRRLLRLEAATPRAIREELRALGQNRAALLEILAQLPPQCLVMLEALVDGAGHLHTSALLALVGERTGVKPSDARKFLPKLFAYGLAVQLVSQSGYAGYESIAVVDSCAKNVAELVSGITLPKSPPPDEPGAGAVSESERVLLALATLTAHRRIRVNADGTPNRGSLKSAVKTLGIDVELADTLLCRAFLHGLLRQRNDAYCPVLGELRRAAHEGLAGSESEKLLAAWLPESGWFPVERFLREQMRQELAERRGLGWFTSPSAGARAFEEPTGRYLEARNHAGHLWVRRRKSEMASGGDGHVTPNLEVYLGPAAHPELIALVGLGSELVRIDKVLTFRITPASVAAGSVLGFGIEEFLLALERVGPRGLADSVRTTVRDFGRRVTLASADRGWLVRLPDGAAEAFAKKHAKLVLDRVAPGILFVRGDVGVIELDRSLAELDVRLVPPKDEQASELSGGEDNPSRQAPRPVPHVLGSEPNPELERLVEDDRRSQFALSRERFEALTRAATSDASTIAALVESAARGLSERARRVVAGAIKLGERILPELERWDAVLSPADRALIERERAAPLNLLPYLALRPEWRAKVLKRARTLDELAVIAVDLGTSSRHTPDGHRLMLELRDGSVLDELERFTKHLDALLADGAAGVSGVAALGGEGQVESKAMTHAAEDDDFDDDDLDDDDLDDDDLDDDLDDDDLDDDDLDDFEEPTAPPREHAGATTKLVRPDEDAFPELGRDAVLERVTAALRTGKSLYVRTRAGAEIDVQALVPEGLKSRGGKTLLLAFDLDTEQGRALELSTIESVLPAD